MNTTEGISTEQLLDEIRRLQMELDQANESVDDKLDKLEEAGFERSDALADAMLMMMETARAGCDGNGDKLGQGLARPGRL